MAFVYGRRSGASPGARARGGGEHPGGVGPPTPDQRGIAASVNSSWRLSFSQNCWRAVASSQNSCSEAKASAPCLARFTLARTSLMAARHSGVTVAPKMASWARTRSTCEGPPGGDDREVISSVHFYLPRRSRHHGPTRRTPSTGGCLCGLARSRPGRGRRGAAHPGQSGEQDGANLGLRWVSVFPPRQELRWVLRRLSAPVSPLKGESSGSGSALDADSSVMVPATG